MRSDRALRLGVVGVGRIAQAHLDACLELKDRVRVVAVADVAVERAREVAAERGIPRAYGSYQELLNDDSVDAVIVCVPHNLHRDVGLAAVAAGKHVLMEKPLATCYRDAALMVEAAEKARVTLMVGQSRRFSDAVSFIMGRKDELGEVLRVVTNFLVYFPAPPTSWWTRREESGNLILLLQGTHSVDFACWLVGKIPDLVFASTRSVNPACSGSTDEGDLLMVFDGGVTASVHLSLNCNPPIHQTVVEGAKGVFVLEEKGTGKPFRFSNTLSLNGRVVVDGEQIPTNYTLQLAEFVTAVAEGRAPLASGSEVLGVMRVMDAADESARTGRSVHLQAVAPPTASGGPAGRPGL